MLLTATANPHYAEGVTVAGGNGYGDALNQTDPGGICVDKQGNLYVVDVFSHRVQKWAPGAKEGVTVAGGNGDGDAPNQLNTPYDVKVDEEGNIYVSDAANSRIQKWPPGATEGITVAGGNGYGSAANQLYVPMSICFDRQGNLYIADDFNDRIQMWKPGATEGITVAGGNGGGSAANQTNSPTGVFVDTLGNIYVTGDGLYTNRVQKWVPGATEGITVAGGIYPGNGTNQFNTPYRVFIDKLGSLYVVDQFNDRIQKYLPGATEAVSIVWGHGNGPAELYLPTSIWVVEDTVYVADNGNYRVQRFVPDNTVAPVADSFIPANGGNYTATAVFKNYGGVTGNAVHIKGLPKFKAIKGQQRNLCGGGVFTYSVEPLGEADAFNWVAPQGCTIVNGQGTNTINLSIPGNFISGVLAVQATNSCGTGPLFYDTLTTKPAKPGEIKGPAYLNTYDTVVYRVNPVAGLSYRWEIPVAGVKIINGQNTNAITVVWSSFQGGNVVVKAAACTGGTESSERKYVSTTRALQAAGSNCSVIAKATAGLKVYPNPAQDKATVAFTATGSYTVQLNDAAGRVIKSIKGNNTGTQSITLDLHAVSKGVYFVTVTTGNKKEVVKLTKQ